MKRRVVDVKVLPGQPLDGSGIACIHLFVQDDSGPFVEPSVTQLDEDKRLTCRPARGRLACDPKRTVAPVERGGVTTVTMRTDDARAATCPKCKATPEYAKMMELYERV